MDFLKFFSTKVISAVRFDSKYGFGCELHEEVMKQDFVCRIRYGDLLKDSGDILLYPVSEGFIPSNPFSRKVLKAEGKWLNKRLKAIYDFPLNGAVYADSKYGFKINESGYIGTEHAAFLPCKKLKYRGIIFVAMDFYSFSDRDAKTLRKILISDSMNKKRLFNVFRKLRKKLGDYYETGAGRCNEGFAFYLLRLCNEMPWMFDQLVVLIKEFYEKEKVSEELDESILKEKFKNFEKFHKVMLKS